MKESYKYFCALMNSNYKNFQKVELGSLVNEVKEYSHRVQTMRFDTKSIHDISISDSRIRKIILKKIIFLLIFLYLLQWEETTY